MIEAGVLSDNKAYTLQLGYFFGAASSDDPYATLQFCDRSYCAGFQLRRSRVYVYGGANLASVCTYSEYRGESSIVGTTNWNIRLEIHPNSTSGIAYVGTYSLTFEYNEKLRPSQGLHVKVCRGGDPTDVFQFHLFELGVHLND